MGRARKKTKTRKKQPVRKKKVAAKKRSTTSKTSNVEKRWREYWRCRKELEQSCDTVRSAQEALTQAMEEEQSRRISFDETKAALMELLEVESLSVGIPSSVPKIVAFDQGD